MALIEREAFRNELLSLTYYGDGEYYSGREAERDAIIDRLNEQPTIDPIRAAGKCYCRECKHGRNSTDAFEFGSLTPLCECDYMTLPHRWYEHCSWGVPKEAQGDG